MTFKQIYSIDKQKLTKKEMLLEIGYDAWSAENIAKKLKKHMILDAWRTAYRDGSAFYAVEKIKKYLSGGKQNVKNK